MRVAMYVCISAEQVVIDQSMTWAIHACMTCVLHTPSMHTYARPLTILGVGKISECIDSFIIHVLTACIPRGHQILKMCVIYSTTSQSGDVVCTGNPLGT